MFNGKCSISVRWRFGIIAGIVLAIFACYPQFKMWYSQGEDWQGHYAYNDIDEVAYASYLKALIDGRPRKNDPYTGRDDSADTPQPESLFSIQFAAPYIIAFPSRIFGVPATWAMTISGVIAGFLTAFLCFWLIAIVTEDSLFALAGALVVLCGGALFAGEGAIGEILGTGFSYPYFPFLRRYIPAVGFPAFFGMIISVWIFLKSNDFQKRLFSAAVAVFCFAFLVFTYFYLWTAAAAWVFCVAILILIVRPNDWFKNVLGFIWLGVACFVPLLVYAFLLANRVDSIDNVQLLVYTREFDLQRFPQYISVLVIAVLLIGAFFRLFSLRSYSTVFAISFALVPFILFNQQVITGRALQPIHYQVFIGNYVSGLALVVSFGLIIKDMLSEASVSLKVAISTVAIVAVVWGVVECHYTVRVLDEANIARDNAFPVGERLSELAKTSSEPHKETIFSLTNIHADDSPTVAPQAVLWARHQHVFAGLSWEESKERFYQQMYYQSLDHNWLDNTLRNGDFVSMIALFGWGRHTNRLTSQSKPLTNFEIEEAAKTYQKYVEEFGFEQASSPQLSYLVVPADFIEEGKPRVNLSNLERWYELFDREDIGEYVLFKLRLKSEDESNLK